MKDESRRLLPKQLRAQASPETLAAARAAYGRYRSICSRYPEASVESFQVFYSEWLECRHFNQTAPEAATEHDNSPQQDYRRQFDDVDLT
jgi:hypothetical protein